MIVFVGVQVLCTIAGAITRLFGSNWDMSLSSILAPGMREFALRTGGEALQRFPRLEQVTEHSPRPSRSGLLLTAAW